MTYPGRAVRKNDPRPAVVTALQARLNEIGCGPLEADGFFGSDTESAVKLFQTRRGVLADGVVGPLTWAELFDDAPAPIVQAPSPLLAQALAKALSQEGVREDRGRPNRGPQVDQYLQRVGVDPASGSPWCAAFAYWCFDEAARQLGVANPCAKTARVLSQWARAPQTARIPAEAAFDDPRLIRPGALFVVDHGSGRGHTGLVVKVLTGEIATIEGNTNERGSREGDGVYQKTRSIGSINIGFIDHAR
jgi:peptidoglycan hydrolase-like protein with peptidoglycan-binding domain